MPMQEAALRRARASARAASHLYSSALTFCLPRRRLTSILHPPGPLNLPLNLRHRSAQATPPPQPLTAPSLLAASPLTFGPGVAARHTQRSTAAAAQAACTAAAAPARLLPMCHGAGRAGRACSARRLMVKALPPPHSRDGSIQPMDPLEPCSHLAEHLATRQAGTSPAITVNFQSRRVGTARGCWSRRGACAVHAASVLGVWREGASRIQRRVTGRRRSRRWRDACLSTARDSTPARLWYHLRPCVIIMSAAALAACAAPYTS